MTETNPYCQALGIQVPRLETAMHRPDASHFSLFIVALLERGGPLSLVEAARRFEEAGIAPAETALASLKKCRPGRPPIYRDGDLYALDPHDDETDLWAFRLGLRPPKVPHLQVVRPEPAPLPSPESPLAPAQLDEAWRDGIPWWSAQRIAICILDAHGGIMEERAVLAFLQARETRRQLTADSARYWRSGAIRVQEDGRWALDRRHPAVASARQAVSDRIAMLRRWAALRPDPAVIRAYQERAERQHAEHAARLAAMRRVLVHAFPAAKPEAVVLLDVARREITTLLGEEIAQARTLLADYDFIFAVGVRPLLQRLGFDPEARRLGELGPGQKTLRLNRQGRTLKITLDLLIRGSCGISRPLGDSAVLRGYLRNGDTTRLRRRLEADAKSLFALYQYGRLHGAVRLRWGFVGEWIPAPWVHRDEQNLYGLMKEAHERGISLEIVHGSAPGWGDPWARARRVRVGREE
ncbi:MAG: hypothetical protein FJY75_07735, partial [Candidatus Eisenbacteria bacterium]|nr:hypothetical protein [Candidatus Eisenbacteria bacterium]